MRTLIRLILQLAHPVWDLVWALRCLFLGFLKAGVGKVDAESMLVRILRIDWINGKWVVLPHMQDTERIMSGGQVHMLVIYPLRVLEGLKHRAVHSSSHWWMQFTSYSF